MMSVRRSGPSPLLQWICGKTLPYRHREAVLGDLFEQYAEREDRDGRRVADRWYVRETLRSLGPTVRAAARRAISPRRYGLQDVVAVGWFTSIGVIMVAFLLASGLL